MSKLVSQKSQGSGLAQWNAEQLELIKTQIASGCSTPELMLFGQVCERTGLDPFSRQIYAIKRGGKMTIQTSIDGYRLMADRTGNYAGSLVYWCGDDAVWSDVWLSKEAPAAAKVEVYKLGSNIPFVGVARFDAYAQKGGAGLWEKMPDVMIAKCAEALALRKAFPAELSGLYTREEMGQSDDDTPSNLITQPQQQRLYTIASASGLSPEQSKNVLGRYGFSSSKEITRDIYDDIIADIKAEGEKLARPSAPQTVEVAATQTIEATAQ